MINNGLFTSLRGDWKTPKALYEKLNEEFHFSFDPCPPDHKADGLKIKWGLRNFVNPPYGRTLGEWCEKAFNESRAGRLVVMLLPSRTDTRWFQNFCLQADEIRFIKGRLCFDDQKCPAPFPSVIVVFKGQNPK
jgi:hypothetical protein